MNPPNLFAELKRRNVFRVAGLYLVGAWLLTQVASTVLPTFDVPGWALRGLIITLALGFVPALIFSWVFELTSRGLKRDEDVASEESIAPQTARRMDRMIIIVLVLALAYFAFDKFVLAPRRAVPNDLARQSEAATSFTDRNSIAVLPFANISGKTDEDSFSDGMTEELLNVLARVPQLKVVARTSVFQFKDKSGDIREIGRKLGVTNIVEGSVRRDGEEVRITAQLVRVSDGFHIWSETYDRRLEKVFALQDEIAQRIGDALKLSLGVSVPVVARAPIDPEAYDEYLKGRALLRQRHDLPAAIAHLKAAVANAPKFAAGWSSLSLTYEVSFWHREHMTPAIQAELLAAGAAAAERAAALEPDAAATEHVLGNVARSQFKYAVAEGHYLRAMQIDPSYPDVREDYTELLYQVGRTEDSAHAARQLVTLDPYFGIGWVRVIDAATALDRRAEVEEGVRQLRGITPVHFKGKFGLLDYALAYGRADEARKALVDIETRWPKEAAFARQLLSWALGESGIDARNLGGAIAEMPADEASSYFIAQQDLDGYNAYFESGGAIFQAYYFANLYSSRPAGHAMLRDARVKPMLMRYGFLTYWREKVWPAGCRPLGETDFECGPP